MTFASTAAVLALASVYATGSAALAADPVSHSTGQFLSGQLAGLDLTSVASLGGASAVNTGGPTVTDTAPLSATALSGLTVNAGTVALPLGNVLQLGALNQYASASPDGSALGASGLVTNGGAITTNPSPGTSAASLDLGPLLPASVTSTVGDLRLSIGTIAATATETAGGAQSGDYTLADMNAGMTSPLVAGVSTTLTSTLNTALAAPLAAIRALGVVNNVPNVSTIVASVGNVTSADGCLIANINTGQVNVNLDCVVQQDLGVSLADLPPNTDLGTLLAQEITQQLPTALGTAINQLQQSLLAAFNAMTVTVPFVGTEPVPTNLLTPVLSAVTSTLASVTSTLGTTVVQPLAGAVSNIIGLTVNAQSSSGGTFTETALSVNVLPGLGDLGQLNLASATVGPGTGALPAAPTISTPTDGSTTSDATPTITGAGEPGDTVTVTDSSGTTVCTATVAADGTWSCTPTTAMAVGDQTITATQTNARGAVSPASSPDTFTIVPAAPTITAPADGATITDTTPAISGTGTPGDMVTVSEGGTTVCTATVAADGTWSCTPATALPTGDHTITATQTDAAGDVSPASTADSFTIVPAAPAITGPAPGSDITDNTPVISGTGTPGDTVVVSDGSGNTVCTATVGADGTWSCTPATALPDGSTTLTATQTDPATGAVSAASPADNFTIVPDAPVITTPLDGTTTANTTPTIGGTGTPGDTVTVSEGGTTLCTATVAADGSWSCTPATALPNGTHTIDATQTSADGTATGPASAPITFTVNPAATVPDAPVITSPADGSTTSDDTPPISGTGTAGDTVTVVANGTVVCTATVANDGTWSCTPTTPLTEGDVTLTATQTDTAGNTSVDSAPVTITVLPPAPTITNPADGSTTPDSTPAVSGTGTPGDSVSVTEGGTTICTATVAADGTWSCTPTTPLPTGDHTITATQADAAGDTSAPSPSDTFTVVPPAPAITTPTDGSTTDDNTPTLSGTGVAGDTITVSDVSGNTVCTATVAGDGSWSCTPTTPLPDGVNTLTATQTDAAGDVSPASPAVTVTVLPVAPAITSPSDGSSTTDTTPAISGTGTPGDSVTVFDGTTAVCTATVAVDGTWSCTPTAPLPTGSNTLTATQTDAGGNTSAASAPITFTVLPVAPAITAPANGSTTTDTSPTISGTGTPGDTVTVSEGGTTICTATVLSDGTWSCVPTTPLATGDHTITATQTDAAGDVSPASAADSFTVAPLAPTITSPGDASSTTDTTPAVSGTGTPGDTVTVTEGGTTLCTATVATDGSWSCTPATPLTTGSHTIQATQTDAAGDVSAASPAVTFTVVPAAPTITTPPSGTATDDSTPVISGTGVPGDTVTVMDGTAAVCTAVVGVDGSWSCTPTAPLPDGSNTLTATQTDGLGDISPESAPVTVAVVPRAPVITSPTDGSTTTDTTPTISGTGTPGDSVTVFDGTAAVCTATVQTDGTWSCTPTTPLADGTHSLIAAQSDAGGNTSAASAPVDLTVVPVAPAITSPTDGSSTSDTQPTISGTGTPGDTVTVTEGTTTLCTAAVASDGTWSCATGPTLDNGSHTIEATQAGAAGGPSAASPAVTFTVVPPAPSIASPLPGTVTDDTTPVISGTGVAGDTVTVMEGTAAVCTATVSVDGSWSCTPTAPLPEGPNTLTATQSDAQGDVSALSAPVAVTIAPPAPVITSPSEGAELTDSTPTVSGTGAAGDTVTVGEATTTTCTATVQADGTWSCTPASALPNGSHTIAATQTNATGVTSAASAPVTFTVAAAAAVCTGAPESISIVPDRGPVTGGTSTIITGSGYTGVQTVTFGGTPAASFRVIDDNHIEAVSPPHPAGTVEIVISGPCGTDPLYFTYYETGAVELPGGLAVTGEDLSVGGLLGGLAALVAGLGIVIGTRRRRRMD